MPWNLRRLLVLGGLALALASPAHAGPEYHMNLGDDSLESEPRDTPATLEADAVSLLAPSQRGCITDLIATNFSSRDGARPKQAVAHLTVSRNAAGWSDVNAIRSFFNRTSTDASSNYIIDAEGNCKLIVAETAKAWTQGAANPVSISIEFIHFSTTDPREPWTEAQLRKGALVFADASKRWGFPIRLVNPTGCNWLAGITDHDRLECGNSHVDVGTQEAGDGVHRGTFPMTKFMRYVQEAAEPSFVFFVLGTGEHQKLARSVNVQIGTNEPERLRRFLEAKADLMLKELRQDGDAAVVRKRVG